MSQRVPINLVDTTEGIAAIVDKYWDAFAFEAFQGYVEHGRGAVCLDIRNLETVSPYVEEALDRISYLPESSDEFQRQEMQPLLAKVKEYDPEADVLLFVYGKDASDFPNRVQGYCGRQPSPREVFEKNSANA